MALEDTAPPYSFLCFLQFNYHLFCLWSFPLLDVPDWLLTVHDALELMLEIRRGVLEANSQLGGLDGYFEDWG